MNINYKKLNGNTLKLIACISMLVDHITAGIMIPVVRDGLYTGYLSNTELNTIYKILRAAGRIAFPIFCYLLVEGFIHTKNRVKYARNLLIFGIISEPFFQVCLKVKEDRFNPDMIQVLTLNRDILFDTCNVFFTLFIGLIVIWIIDTIQDKYGQIMLGNAANIKSLVPSAIVVGAGAYLAQYIHSDYRWYGVCLITLFYLLRDYEPLNLIAGYLFIMNLSNEYWSFPGFLLLLCYNKKRGKRLGRLKYLFYIFYPVHLILIYLFRCYFYG